MSRFAEIYAAAGEGLRYNLDERAAIHRFDGGATKEDAERMAAEAYDAAVARAASRAAHGKLSGAGQGKGAGGGPDALKRQSGGRP